MSAYLDFTAANAALREWYGPEIREAFMETLRQMEEASRKATEARVQALTKLPHLAFGWRGRGWIIALDGWHIVTLRWAL